MLTAEYDREMDIAVNRREAKEETREEDYHHFFELLNQDLTKEEIKERLQQEERTF
jgi:hypothetical protein